VLIAAGLERYPYAMGAALLFAMIGWAAVYLSGRIILSKALIAVQDSLCGGTQREDFLKWTALNYGPE
jgi:hypothetical protein